MGRKNQNTFIKKQKEDKKRKKKQEKLKKKEARKNEGGTGSFEDMIAYVDADGNPTSEPPEPVKIIDPKSIKE